MPEAIISASGTQYGAGVDEYNRLMVTGSITSMPSFSVSVGSDVWGGVGSVYVMNTINANFTGSIMIGSVSAQVDSIYIQSGDNINIIGMPKTEVYGSGTFNATGTFTTGSEQWIKNIVGVSGTAFQNILGSVQINTGSIYVTNFSAGTGYAGSDAYIPAGSVIITSMPSIYTAGSTEIFTSTGSVEIYGNLSTIAGSEMWIKAGSVEVYNRVAGSIVNIPNITINNPQTIGSWTGYVGSIWSMPAINVSTGSESWIKNFGELGSSVVVTNIYAGSKVWQGERFGVSGTVDIGNMVGGSIVYMPGVNINNPSTIGSFAGMSNGSIWFGGGVGSMVISGGVIINSPQTIGSFTGMSNGSIWFGGGVGSVIISGIQPAWSGVGSVVNINLIQDVGSPCFQRGILTASGTYTNVWTIGGAGSRLEIHGWHISTNAPGYVHISRSGTTPVVISDWNINYASGITIEKTFVCPIIPNAADVPVGVGATVAGSTLCTIYGREVK